MKLSAVSKLYIGFAVAIFLSVATGITSYLTFQRQVRESDWVSYSYQVKEKITEMKSLAVEMQTCRRGFRATGDVNFLNPYHAARNNISPVIDKLKALVANNPAQVTTLNRVSDNIFGLIAYWDTLPTDIRSYDHDMIVEITNYEKEIMDRVRVDVAKMLDAESRLLVQRQDANKRALMNARLISLAGTLLVLLIVIVLIYFIINEFRNRRVAEEALQNNLDEVNRLNAVANNKNWQLSGTSVLNNSMQGGEDIVGLSKAVVDALVRYLDVPAAALYFYDEEVGKLVMKASASLPANVTASYSLGEGLVGYAGTVRRPIITRNVPSGYWALRSASGTASPGEILCQPLWYNNELKGVLEIASFGNFSRLQTELLETVGDNIAIALNAAHSREKIMQLLDQVQEQKLSLQNQQEELRQTNEELMSQAEVLQASEEELRVQEEELRQINSELEEKNEAVELSRQALAQKARELELTGKYKSEFLANMSHELRTPLNSVLILAKLLSENRGANLTEKQVEYAKVIHKSGTDLLNLINDILDLSKIEAGKIDFHFEETKLSSVLEDMRQVFSMVSEEKSIAYSLQLGNGLPDTIYTDKLRLEQVLKNLLANAFKFTPRGGSVTLSFDKVAPSPAFHEESLRKPGNILQISIADTGIGIPGDKQQLIFEAFQQADGSTSRRYGGTGLGLSISKELVKRLGGEMRLQSEEGKGSRFSVFLPLEAAPAAVETYNDIEPAGAEPHIEKLIQNVKPQTQVPDDRKRLAKGDKVMLIIEDDPQFAKIVQDFARSRKFRTIVALQGDEGLYYVRKYKPSAIILDMQLPVLDGWSLLKIVKADPKLRSIPVHVISALDNLEKLNNSAVAYIRKPVEKDDLEQVFNHISRLIASDIKKILVVSGGYLKNDGLKMLITERHPDVECDYVTSEQETLEKLAQAQYDCVVADIGKDLKAGIDTVSHIKAVAAKRNTPVIIYLDKDLTNKDEMRLKKISDVIIQDSKDAKDRLMDELELFLYKMEEANVAVYPRAAGQILDEKPLAGKKVLLADDDIRNVFALATLLEEERMNVLTAMDGKEAIDMLQEHPDIDIVLMDVMMPEMDGYEAMKKIRADQRFRNLPVIALTAKAMQGDRERSIEAGASDYISKPVDSNKLFSLMRVWLSV